MLTQEMRQAIGAESSSAVHLVEPGAIRRFAEAIGDADPRYHGDGAAGQSGGGMAAPPTFSRTMRPSPAIPEFDAPYTGILDGGSEWEYLRPIRPGDMITATTRLVDLREKSGRLGDMLLAARETTFVNQRGVTAVRERDTEIYYDDQSAESRSAPAPSAERPAPVRGQGAAVETGGARFGEIEAGTRLPTLTKRPGIRQLVMYAGASGDFYEIHYDRDFANARGLDEVIVHGALKSAFLGQLLTGWIGEEGVLDRLSVQYRGMDTRGQALHCTGVVTGKRARGDRSVVDCELWIENERGHRTTHGSATVVIV